MKSVLFLFITMTVLSCKEKKAEYLYGVPPEPPFQEAKAIVNSNITDGCHSPNKNLIAYLISYKENRRNELELIVQDRNGVRTTCFLEKDRMSNADKSWLPYILIPGNKIEMKVQYCGSGGYTYIMSLKNRKRKE